MAGVRIGVEVSGGISSLSDFRKALKDSGAEAKLTENEIKRLEERFQQKLQADKAASALDHFTRAAGLSAKEAQGLSVSLGLASDAAKKFSVGQDALAKTISDLDAKLASLSAVVTKTSAAFSSFKFDEVANQSSKLASSLGATSDAAKKLAQSKEDLTRSAGALDSKTQGLTGSIGSAVLKVGALATAYVSLREAMRGVKDFVEMGIGFNSSIESAQLGIASVLAATQNIANAEGQRLDGMEKLNAAQAISRDLMKDIQRMGLETTATTQQLVDGFQALVGPATAAGLTLDQTKNTMVGIVQAFAALKIPMEQLSAEARSLFDGDIKLGQDRLAGVLGLTKEMVLTWQKQGTYVENLNKKLEFFRLAGAESAKTWAGLASNTKEVLEVFAGSATQGLFTGAKQAMSEFTSFALDTKNAGLGGEMQQISAGMREIGEYLGQELVSLTREFINYLKSASKDFDADEVRKKMEEIGTSAKETASAVGNVAVAVGKLLNTTLTGWNSLPEPIRDIGLIFALVGGAKMRAAIVGLATAVGYVKELWQYASNIVSLDNPGAVAGIKRADFNISRIDEEVSNAKGFLNANGRFVSKDKEIDSLKKQKEYWENWKKGAKAALVAEAEAAGTYSKERASAERAFADGSVPRGAGYKVSPIVDKAQEQEKERLKKSQEATLDAWASSPDKKLAAFAKREKAALDAYNKVVAGEINHGAMEQLVAAADQAYTEALKKGSKEGGAIAKADAEAIKLINEARGKAHAAEANLLGDPWGQKEAQATTEYQKSLDELNVKLAGYKGTQKEALAEGLKYWAEYEYGIKKAQIAYDAWKEDMTFWANNLKSVGQMSFDPSKTMAGETMGINQQATDTQRQIDSRASAQARRIWDDAVEATKKGGADVSAIWAGVNDQWLATEKKRLVQTEANNQEAELKKVKLREDTLGDLAKLDDAYQARREEGFKTLEKALRDLGVSETRIAQDVSLKKDKSAKEFLETRLQYEDSFAGYLSDALSLEYGLYKSAYGRQLDAYKQYADAIIKGLNGIADAFSDTLGDALGDAITGQFKGVQNYIDSLLKSLKSAFASFISDMAKYAFRNYITVPIVGQIMGTTGSFGTGTTSLNGASSGGSGLGIGDLLQGASMAKNAYSLFGSSSAASSAAASSGYGLTGASAEQLMMAEGGVAGVSTTTPVSISSGATASTGSLWGSALHVAGPAVASAGLGYMAGNLLRPDNPTASYVGAGAGLLAGGLTAAMTSLTALASTGVGALVAIPAAIAAAALTPNTVTTTWDKAAGSQNAIMVQNGQLVPLSYGTTKQTSEGMGGSSSTSHAIWFQGANEKQTAEETAAWTTANASLTAFTKALNFSDDQLTAFAEGFTTAPLDAVTYDAYNIFAGYLAEHVVGNMGLADQVRAVANDGESFVETLARVATGINTAKSAILASGIEIRDFYQGMDAVQIGDRVSDLVAAVGSADEFVAALTRAAKYSLSSAEVARVQALGYERQMNDLVSQVGESVDASAIQAGTFWEHFRKSIEMPDIDPERFADLAAIAKTVEAWEAATKNLEQIQMATHVLEANLEVRKLAAQGMSDESSIMALQVQQEQELAQARWDGYTTTQLATLTEVQALEMQKAKADLVGTSLEDLMSSVDDAFNELTDTDIQGWLRGVVKQVGDWVEQAEKLGASEEQLARIRSYETEAIANKLSDYMEGIESSLAEHVGNGLAYSVASMKKELSTALLDASLLGATQSQLTDIGTEYAYKVKDLYQTKIDDVANKLKSVATTMKSFTDTLDKTLKSLWVDNTLSPLNASQKYIEARRQWEETVFNLGSADDTVRNAAMSDIESQTSTFLQASMAANAEFSSYYADFMKVQTVLGEQSKTIKSEYEILQGQLDAALGTAENTETTASLLDQLNALQKEQGDTWTQMMADLPQKIADAILSAMGVKSAVAGASGGSLGNLSYGAYGSADAWDLAYTQAEQAYLQQKASELNATATNGKTDWNVYDVASSIAGLGLTPYEHFFEYGSGEYNPSTSSYLAWNGPTTMAPRNISTGDNSSFGRDDVIGPNLDIGSAFNASTYLANKVDQLNATATDGRSNWTVDQVQAALAANGLTPEQHFAQYGQYEGVAPYASGGIVEQLARSGGYLPGYSATDVQPAILRLGEYVMTPEAVQEYGVGFFDALNNRRARGFAAGGYVSPVSGAAYASPQSVDNSEVRALRQEVAELKGIIRSMASDMRQSRDSLDKIEYNTAN